MRFAILAGLFAATSIATEVVYMTNGINSYDCGQTNYQESLLAYYNDISQSQSGQMPQDTAYIGCGWFTWEGQQHTETFSSGTTFTWQLDANAGSYSVGQYAGWAYNSYGTNFACFRDNGRQLYSNQGRASYNSIYYCKQS